MLMDRDYELNIQRIINFLNIKRELAEKIYKECGTNIDKIYLHLKKLKINTHVVGGKLYTHCLRCGKPLKSIESKLLGYGSVCFGKVQHKMKKLSLIGVNYVDNRTKETG